MAASLNGEFKRLDSRIDALAEKLDNLEVNFRILTSQLGGIDNLGQSPKPKRAGYGGKASTLKSGGA